LKGFNFPKKLIKVMACEWWKRMGKRREFSYCHFKKQTRPF